MNDYILNTPAVQPASPPDAIDVSTELVYLRSRRFITANDCLMAESLFQCQIAAASNEAQLAEISAQWMAQLAALKAVS